MNREQVLKDIVTLINGDSDLNHQVRLVNQYKPSWNMKHGREYLNLSDGEVLDLVYDIAREAV